MSQTARTSPDRIIAHVELLRAVDRLLVQADAVREKRALLEQLLPELAGTPARRAPKAVGATSQ